MFPRQWRRLSLLSMSVLFLSALGGACAGDTPTEPRVPSRKLVVSAVRSTISAGLAGLALMPSLETIAIFATKQHEGCNHEAPEQQGPLLRDRQSGWSG